MELIIVKDYEEASDLAFVGIDNRWTLEAGEFRVKCGDQSIMITCTETKVWDTPNKD